MDFASLTYPEVAVLWVSHFQRPYNCLGDSHETYLRHWLIKGIFGICKVFWGKTHEQLCSALCKPADVWTLVAKPLSTGGNRCICPACAGFASALGQIRASCTTCSSCLVYSYIPNLVFPHQDPVWTPLLWFSLGITLMICTLTCWGRQQASSCHEGSPIGVAASGVEADRELKNEYSWQNDVYKTTFSHSNSNMSNQSVPQSVPQQCTKS